MRIFVHDYAGHAFAVELSRCLARRGHEVRHAYCTSTHCPRGVLDRRPDDPDTFDIQPLDLGAMIPKSGYFRRLRMESAYSRLVAEACRRFHPDIVLSGNTPSIPQRQLVRACRSLGIRHVFWIQDIYGLATYKLLSRRLPGVGHLVGKAFIALDRQSARQSDAIVVITEDFKPVLDGWGVDPDRVHVIENWAVLADLPMRPRDNAWAQQHQLTPGPRLLYAGTLAMKHNPALLLELARRLDHHPDAELVVVSEGAGVEWLQRMADTEKIGSLRCFGFQPFDQMANVLGSSDILVVILEADAGAFSVPSKALSYLCAARPILGAMPGKNLAARLVTDHGAGIVVEPDDIAGFCRAADQMLQFPETGAAYAAAARRYAEENFDMDHVASRFEAIFQATPSRQAASSPAATMVAGQAP